MIDAFQEEVRSSLNKFLYFDLCQRDNGLILVEDCKIDLVKKLGFIQASLAVVNQYKDIAQNFFSTPEEIYGSDKYKISSKKKILS